MCSKRMERLEAHRHTSIDSTIDKHFISNREMRDAVAFYRRLIYGKLYALLQMQWEKYNMIRLYEMRRAACAIRARQHSLLCVYGVHNFVHRTHLLIIKLRFQNL